MSDQTPGRRRKAGRRVAGPNTGSSTSKGASRTRSSSSPDAAKVTGSGASTSRSRSRSAGAAGAAGAGAAAGATSAKSARAAKGATARSSAAASSARTPKKNLLNYPRAGKKGAWKWLPSWRLLTTVAALLILAGVGFGVWLYNDTEVPEASDVALAQTSRVYFSDGETLMGEFSELNRTILPEDQIPQNVKDAVVASEDSTFYENRGISPKGIIRAAVNNLQGGARQGGSTITQQYVENYYTGTVTSYSGKVKEMIMALKVDQEVSKDEILARYLNTIYFGRSAYGIEAASQAYFGKPASELTDSEAALLVAVIPAPSAYDPANNPEVAQDKWARVIERQVNATGTMSEADAEKLTFPEVIEYSPKNKLGGTNGYLLAAVKKELEANGIDADAVDTGGYTIVSTIDKGVQDNTVAAIQALPEDRPERNRVGTVTLDPSTGAIRGMYGGPNFVEQAQNDATQSRMQGGSIFKSFALVAAIEDGFGLYSRWDGNSPAELPGWTVKNFGDTSYGTVTLVKATENSINTAYAELNMEMGPDKTREMAVRLGLPEDTPGLDNDITNVLGTASPTVQEMAEAYGTLANGGIHHDAYIVQTVTGPNGETAYEHEDQGERVIDEAVAANATVALEGPPSRGGSARVVAQSMDGRPVAGKTGTSQSFRSAWFVGFTPQLVTSVGMFQPSADGRTEEQLTPFGGVENMTGGKWPAQIWVDIMKPSLEGQEMLDFPGEMKVDAKPKSGTKTRKPTTKAPAPTTEAPTTEAPTTEAPTTEAPTTEAPTTEAPTTEAPTTEAPTTEAPAPDPTTEAPAPDPTTQQPAPDPTTTKAPAASTSPGNSGGGNGNGNGGNGTGNGNGGGNGTGDGTGDTAG